MKVTIFTGNQPRHIALISKIASVSDHVFAIQECNTVFPGAVADFYRKSETMQEYFSHVIVAEGAVFGDIGFSPPNVQTLSLKDGDLNGVDKKILDPALESDLYIVFGASYIKGPLIEFLVERRAVNIHMGVSPYYRGSSCNFWALYDGNPSLVGATIHLLSRGLDSGNMLFHALPKPQACDPFLLGMRAVQAAHVALMDAIVSGAVLDCPPVAQDKTREIRYTRNKDFTDEVAREYLDRKLDAARIGDLLSASPAREFLRPAYI
jgi:hypothetical protein